MEIMVSNWNAKPGTVEALKSLDATRGITVKIVTIPEAKEGFIPFARTIHAKYMVVDGEKSWIGTSNWARDYFYESRNVGLIVDGPRFAQDLERIFRRLWAGPYAEDIDLCRDYKRPKIGSSKDR